MTTILDVQYLDSYKTLNLPSLDYSKPGDAGIDLRTTEDAVISYGSITLVKTGVKIAIPTGNVMLIFSRSGLALKSGINLANNIGVIDSSYRGEIQLPLTSCKKSTSMCITAGKRVAQFFVIPLFDIVCRSVENLDETERGTNGLGSTGVR